MLVDDLECSHLKKKEIMPPQFMVDTLKSRLDNDAAILRRFSIEVSNSKGEGFPAMQLRPKIGFTG